jgi:spore germination protein GerM
MTPKKQKRTTQNRAKSRPAGCLIWLIPLSLGLIVLMANPKVTRDIQDILTTPRKNPETKKDTSRAEPGTPRQEAAPEIPENIIRPTPDTSALRDIITRDMMEQEQKLKALLEEEGRRANNTVDAANPQETSFSVRIFFVYYDEANDQLLLRPVRRTLRQGDTPALTTLQALLSGPTQEEMRAGYRTLLPKNLQVRRMHVDNGILLIDLSRDFLYNHTMGQEGIILQIYQIVNSMTDFSTVRAVRFLIEGQQHSTIGGDGIPFDQPFRHNERPLIR